jgi:hypothetical protein
MRQRLLEQWQQQQRPLRQAVVQAHFGLDPSSRPPRGMKLHASPPCTIMLGGRQVWIDVIGPAQGEAQEAEAQVETEA